MESSAQPERKGNIWFGIKRGKKDRGRGHAEEDHGFKIKQKDEYDKVRHEDEYGKVKCNEGQFNENFKDNDKQWQPQDKNKNGCLCFATR